MLSRVPMNDILDAKLMTFKINWSDLKSAYTKDFCVNAYMEVFPTPNQD